ncbi:MAG TPA: Glu/Leu/Phe/Val dehydrogenase dimerization domain-containing protein [Thermoleophilaceae bacterium]|nr:Glu/Leu/Phe/Val dehydrogenase dimerization domain-containing protein [Thermoleophilaceae bacterium]
MTIQGTSSDISLEPAGLLDIDHERLVIRHDPESGMRLAIAVHSTALGPALGGLRLRAYPGGMQDAVSDVLALARTMTLKASAAGLDLGGGKAVMVDDGGAADPEVRRARLEAAADAIDELAGAYITAEDIGTTTDDIDLMAGRTRYAVGRSVASGGGGDPSPVTAETVFRAMRCGLAAATGSDDLDGRTVGVIGLGKVGGRLAEMVARAGARVIVCDLDAARAERFRDEHGGEVAPSAEAVIATELDVLAPCAAGGMIDQAIAGGLAASVVCGAANNPVADRATARRLAERGILYVPDFLANCGGLIHVETEWRRLDGGADLPRAARVEEGIGRAMERLEVALVVADRDGAVPLEIAERQALERVRMARAEGVRAAA